LKKRIYQGGDHKEYSCQEYKVFIFFVLYVTPIDIKKIVEENYVVNIVYNNIVFNKSGKNGNMEHFIMLCKIAQ
jgi:hypothetical protein